MATATFYHINTTVAATGQTHQSDYWPDGEGQKLNGYVTSMSQYCAELSRYLADASNLALYVVGTSGASKRIDDDEDLKDAVDSLPNRAVLAVTAVAHSSAHNTSNTENKRASRRARRRRNNRSTTSDDEWNARPHDTATKWYDEPYSFTDEEGAEYTNNVDENDSHSDSDSDTETEIESTADHSDHAVNVGSPRIVTNKKNVNAIMRRFDVPTVYNASAVEDDDSTECYHCETTEWKGAARFCYSTNTAYHLCTACYKQLPKSQKKDWQHEALEKSTAVWNDDAPEYPLHREEEVIVREEVRHLQYLLTRLGFMPLNATKQLVGSYQGNTESAVRRFREHYGVYGGNMEVYNKKTAQKLGQVVRHMRAQGYMHL